MKTNISEPQTAVRKHKSTSKYSKMIQLSTIRVQKAYFDQKMLFLKRRNPQSDQNPKNFQFHQKQIQFPIDCATSRPNRPTELRDIIENRILFFWYQKKKIWGVVQNIALKGESIPSPTPLQSDTKPIDSAYKICLY